MTDARSETDMVEAAAMAMHEELHPSQTPWAVAPESWRESYRKQARVAFDVFARLAASRVPEGWQLVPKEPTEAMLKAGRECQPFQGNSWTPGQITAHEVWDAMLAEAAAPSPETRHG